MLLNKIVNQYNWLKFLAWVTGLAGWLYSNTAYAVLTVNAQTMLENFSIYALPNFMRFVTAFAYVTGMFFVFKGIMELKRLSESRTMMSYEHHLTKPLLMLGVGAALLYLPSSVQAGMSTFWSDPTPYAYLATTGDPWAELIKSCFMMLQLIGTISLIRGLVGLTHLGGQGGGQPGAFGKAVTHIVAGILCIDMYDFVNAMVNTLALGQI